MLTKNIGVLSLVFAAALANGTMTFNGVDALSGVVTIGGTHYSGGVYAGLLDFSETSLGNVATYCVDLDHAISNGQSWPDTFWDTSTYAIAGVRYAGNLVAADYGAANTADKAVGLQLAVWEARYDNIDNPTPDFEHGEFTASGYTSGALDAANTYWQDRFTAGSALLIRNEDGHGQDQLAPVPEPASLAVLGLGVLALIRRKRVSS